ncbi:arabinofuranosyltransferase [Nocardia fusca]|uniref:Galactan 5-O-arabinofuranosyltransferase n=1 Tax=Nocardia fusca TaxID=941183 RepID=A0ABV3F8P7_9NOCA
MTTLESRDTIKRRAHTTGEGSGVVAKKGFSGAWRLLREAVAAALVALCVASGGLTAFSLVQWPAFTTSNVLRALTTVGQVASVALLVASALMQRRATETASSGQAPRRTWVTKLLSWAGVSGLVTATLAIPLAATRLYIAGLEPEQQKRTGLLTALSDSPGLRDSTYPDLPSDTAAGWFWIGGRLANLAGVPAWELFKPFSVVSIAVAAAVAMVWWTKLGRSLWMTGAAVVTTVAAIVAAADDPPAVIALLMLGPALVTAWGAVRPQPVLSGWGPVVLIAASAVLCAGIDEHCFTLLAVSLVVMVVASVAAARMQSRKAFLSLKPLIVVMAVVAVSGAVMYGPYLLALITTPASERTDIGLSASERALPWPIDVSALGALGLVGLLWLVARVYRDRFAQAIALGVVATYVGWLLSVLAGTAAMTSLQAEQALRVLLAAAGIFASGELVRELASNIPSIPIQRVALALGVIATVAVVQEIPTDLRTPISAAYTDTDGYGDRADGYPPAAPTHFDQIDQAIRAARQGQPRDQTTVLTGDSAFFAYHPYPGFLSQSDRYSNRLADYNRRVRQLSAWANLPNSESLVDELDAGHWDAPEVFLLRETPTDYTLRIARDTQPSDLATRSYTTIRFPRALFDSDHFTTTSVGPFAVIARK